MSGLLEHKIIVVMGVANERSIGWGIAKSLHKQGARLIFTYRKERSLAKLTELLEVERIVPRLVTSCDVTDDASIEQAFQTIRDAVGGIDGVVHSIAYANKEDMAGRFAQITREGYMVAQSASSYSLIAVAREAAKSMNEGGSIVAQSYVGAERVVKSYNVMGVAKAALEAAVKYLAEDLGESGIRVNAISCGPVRTISAKGVPGFNELMSVYERRSPLRRNVDQDEVGDATMFLLSGLARGVTGEVLHVDGGYHAIGI